MKGLKIGILFLILGVLVACGNNESGDTDSATTNDSKELRLAHNLSEDHPIHQALTTFVDSVEEKTDGSITFKIFPNGVLGSESDVLEQVQNGSVDMTKVSAGALESFSDEYAVFSIPYIFTSDTHYRNVMESDVVEEIYQSTEDKGFVGISYFDSGARSFYTVDTPIKTPEDLQGLNVRVMDSQTAIDMVDLLGGTPTPLGYNEIYTSLQQGVIDGAESNPTALTTGQHGEVAKNFSYSEHTNIPDILVVSTDLWNSLSDEEREIFKEAADETRKEHTELWNQAIEESVSEAKEMGVEFNEVDKEPFIELVQPLHEEYKKDERLAEIMNAINELDE
ncbi:tripartite ATP-independent transporter solute receptor, DctP family [Gracilibacillus orientalis]|uniref:Tripartite ATP-independent transporter solute receptor, DctP family n=1 Tax=Gracilibacillus orientalis TaxID=334253 RepID=A0A1I4IFY7_9BACI|nr:TRAP transporter substrate-binding protein [Gracilibacillus orientalis]SFL52933.1 tripartite ATP-independent transporter solute receptor, DctP family [Gracilibacillus orientalis]